MIRNEETHYSDPLRPTTTFEVAAFVTLTILTLQKCNVSICDNSIYPKMDFTGISQ